MSLSRIKHGVKYSMAANKIKRLKNSVMNRHPDKASDQRQSATLSYLKTLESHRCAAGAAGEPVRAAPLGWQPSEHFLRAPRPFLPRSGFLLLLLQKGLKFRKECKGTLNEQGAISSPHTNPSQHL